KRPCRLYWRTQLFYIVKAKLKNANEYCLFEENKENGTKATIKTKQDTKEKIFNLQKQYWQLNYFMEEVL
ncbi:MAG: hypothetical protein OXJ52_09335, partial [Oligoflexia bacterium]|nr:hypothetical protein [Oligoflexia bacterium]